MVAAELPGLPGALLLRATHPLARGRDEPGLERARLAAAEDRRVERRHTSRVLGVAHGFVADDLDARLARQPRKRLGALVARAVGPHRALALERRERSEEHTSELQSRRDLVCRLLLV